jgi:hypothetical protein
MTQSMRCGEQFIIYHDYHDFAGLDRTTAARQAHWLEKVLAEEHERERQHADRIELPHKNVSAGLKGSHFRRFQRSQTARRCG